MIDFIIGGVQKAGTSSLHNYLTQHPHLQGSKPKELHFFDDEKSVDWAAPDYAPYHRHFEPFDPSRKRFESTPIYLWWPPALERIRAYRPDIRLIFSFRDPIERAWSQWAMKFAAGIEKEDFPTAAALEPERLAAAGPLGDGRRGISYLDRGFYGAQVARLLALFPREQILFLASIDLARDPTTVLARVADFLDIEPFPPMAPQRVNARAAIDYPSTLTPEIAASLRSRFRDDLLRFTELTAIDTAGWLTLAA